MLSPYRRIFEAPGSAAFSGAGLLSRMPLSMTGIGIVTMLSQMRGSYGLAGAVTAVLMISEAIFGPQISRLVDRFGQRRVALPATAVSLAGLAGLLVCARWEAPDWTLFATAVPVGCMPTFGSMVRARWAHIYADDPQRLHTAYSFESVADELCFIAGPILAVGLSTAVLPEAGPLLSGAFLAVGAVLFCTQRRTEPPIRPADGRPHRSAIRSPGLRVLMLTFAATGAVFGAIDVVTVAYAEDAGHKGLASLALAVYAAGSCLAGIAFGMIEPRGSAHRRFLIGVAGMALSLVPLLFAGNLAWVAAALFLAGMSVAPTMVTTMSLVAGFVPARQLNEGMSWTITGLALGVAAGSSIGGAVVDAHGAAAGYGVPVAAGALAALTALAGLRHLRAAPHASPHGQIGPDAASPQVRADIQRADDGNRTRVISLED
ncbi:MFS transporter [Yinghuangia sp. ASG 101]|uniref:MFS transporter n=1 Tax=Yinghuangia sp. ASG 101 TaxID=2896848 RepID=UPI001E4A5867|nr:MFS transporter [Yinghuangia sp. ASG 101]UGQ15548.1 MFS transporter [Yinghuangia sp. ASG 101]